jgi:predicted dienelactone hydrolase
MNNPIDLAQHIPTTEAALTVAYTPIPLPMVGRPPLELRLTAPATVGNIPIVLLSHGFGPSNYIPSKDGYAPLAQFWAERGFAVTQPTHASSRVGGLPSEAPGAPFFWRERVEETRRCANDPSGQLPMGPAVPPRELVENSLHVAA